MAEGPPPLLVIISGPSGVGKDAVFRGLKRPGRPWHFLVTATTRPMRAGEADGMDYIFMSRDGFMDLVAQGGFLEHAEVYGHLYGVPREQVADALANGMTVVLKVDVQGTSTIKGLVPEALAIQLTPGSLEELEDRLAQRGTESPSTLKPRLAAAEGELRQAELFDYQVRNVEGQLAQTVAFIEAIIEAEQRRQPARRVVL